MRGIRAAIDATADDRAAGRAGDHRRVGLGDEEDAPSVFTRKIRANSSRSTSRDGRGELPGGGRHPLGLGGRAGQLVDRPPGRRHRPRAPRPRIGPVECSAASSRTASA